MLGACETGTGKQVKGEGLIALTRGFMYAGAERLVASLWRVDDQATAVLMTSFYEQMCVITSNRRQLCARRKQRCRGKRDGATPLLGGIRDTGRMAPDLVTLRSKFFMSLVSDPLADKQGGATPSVAHTGHQRLKQSGYRPQKLLISCWPCLVTDRDEAGKEYQKFRIRLIRFFEWRRLCLGRYSHR